MWAWYKVFFASIHGERRRTRAELAESPGSVAWRIIALLALVLDTNTEKREKS